MNNIDKWCMKWNKCDANVREYFKIVREDQRLFDVTLVTDDGQHIQAHKIILSAGSHFFSNIFLRSNQTNMLIYLKGINSVQLEQLLDFIYNGEASVGQEELKQFIETGKELQVKDFEAYVAGLGENVEKEELHKNRDNITEEMNIDENIICDTLNSSPEHYSSSEGVLKPDNDIQKDVNIDLDLQILQLIEKSDGMWKCKICGKTTLKKSNMQGHAESHIEGMSHACHICYKSYPNRRSLRGHINEVHTELLSCDLCKKSGMNKGSLRNHKAKQHKSLS